ncbi:c-type cytochrome [Methylobacterium sp. SyP6R]|uniref:c-type cytochrome n=1 Tax=Methylobacterium sp. SyP6R TaxID=2718876 RepID=UPI001F37FF6E|nr:cytochrome c [Methylobacterium sp. SyP6R]MCF4129499.1 cytochrome c [Methylobacterium sp. SyP6R]
MHRSHPDTPCPPRTDEVLRAALPLAASVARVHVAASRRRAGASSLRPSAALRTVVLAALLATGARPHVAFPEVAAAADVARGRLLAVQLCSRCHVVGREQSTGGFVGPSFIGIAAMPSTTGVALSVFLQSHHQRMPSLQLERAERDAIIDYILSLQAGQRATR